MERDFYLLRYLISEEKAYKESNVEAFEAIQKALFDSGISLEISHGNELTLMLHSGLYEERKKRNAGRREKNFLLPSSLAEELGHVTLRYADIVFLEQSKTSAEICSMTGISQSTYFRHKRKLLESAFYKNLDRNRLSDHDYLSSREDNFFF